MSPIVLITGVHGFCARHLTSQLMADGMVNLYGADFHAVPPDNVELKGYSRLDVTVKPNVGEIIRALKPEIVFHLAGIVTGEEPDIYHVNFLGAIHVLEALRKHSPESRVLLVGSAAEYGHVPDGEMPVRETHPCNPFTAYGISKYAMTMAATRYAREHGMKVIVARPFNIIGAGMPTSLVVGAVMARIREALQEQRRPVVVPVGNLETKRDFVSIEDVVKAYIAMVRGPWWGEVFNICSGVPRSIRSLLEELLSYAPCPIRLQTKQGLQRPQDVPVMYGSLEKAQKAFGFIPKKNLSESLRDAWNSSV